MIKTQNLFHFVRYALISAIALGVDVGLLVLCHDIFGMHYLAAATIGFSIGVIVNYTLGILWVFKESRFQSRGVEFIATAGVAAVGLAINDGVMWLLVEHLAIFYLAAKIIAASAVFFWNFFIRQNYIHAPSHTNLEPNA